MVDPSPFTGPTESIQKNRGAVHLHRADKVPPGTDILVRADQSLGQGRDGKRVLTKIGLYGKKMDHRSVGMVRTSTPPNPYAMGPHKDDRSNEQD
jgi:hypothetical protein